VRCGERFRAAKEDHNPSGEFFFFLEVGLMTAYEGGKTGSGVMMWLSISEKSIHLTSQEIKIFLSLTKHINKYY
jgi:hypothetical protein